MYERELGSTSKKPLIVSGDMVEKFRELQASVLYRSVISWEEHCSECALPQCYTTCAFYAPRSDLKCRRFVEGIVGLSVDGLPGMELMQIEFKRWGRLEGSTTLGTITASAAKRREIQDYWVARLIHRVPLPFIARLFLVRKRRAAKQPFRASGDAPSPTQFVVEALNSSSGDVHLLVGMRPALRQGRGLFQVRIALRPGYNRIFVPVEEIQKSLEVSDSILVEISPADTDGQVKIILGMLDFVVLDKTASFLAVETRRGPQSSSTDAEASRPKVKCVIWDLDDTLWNGTLIEGGIHSLCIDSAVVNLIKEFDRKGILQSIATKNIPEDAMAALKAFGLQDYFLYPQIGWNTKSDSIRTIAKLLDIGLDTCVFIDDQPFERAEVSFELPEVECYAPSMIATLHDDERFQLPITEVSKSRRLLYIVEQKRHNAEVRSEGNYLEFLKSCYITAELDKIRESNRERVYELVQRTNQMNFSGNRYNYHDLEQVVRNSSLNHYVISCHDKFGDYGIIGFAVVDVSRARIVDLMFSCRIQRKWVDISFLQYIMTFYNKKGFKRLEIVFRRTSKNEHNAVVFEKLGFTPSHEEASGTVLMRSLEDIPDDPGIVHFRELGS
jgi:FkbH-like protein